MRCYFLGHFCNSFNDVLCKVGYKHVSFVQRFPSKLDMVFKYLLYSFTCEMFPQICCHLLYVVNLSPIGHLSFVF